MPDLTTIVHKIAINALSAPGTIIEYMDNESLTGDRDIEVGQRFVVKGLFPFFGSSFIKIVSLDSGKESDLGWNPRLFRKVG